MTTEKLKDKLKKIIRISAICLGLMVIPFGISYFIKMFAKLYMVIIKDSYGFMPAIFGYVATYLVLAITIILIYKFYTKILIKKVDKNKYEIVGIISILESVLIVPRIIYVCFIREWKFFVYDVYPFLTVVLVIASIYKLVIIFKIKKEKKGGR